MDMKYNIDDDDTNLLKLAPLCPSLGLVGLSILIFTRLIESSFFCCWKISVQPQSVDVLFKIKLTDKYWVFLVSKILLESNDRFKISTRLLHSISDNSFYSPIIDRGIFDNKMVKKVLDNLNWECKKQGISQGLEW